jgi:hypothetical protein
MLTEAILMNKQTYNQWWQLHQRVRQGETLIPQEQAHLIAGFDALDYVEKVHFQSTGLNAIRQLRTNIEELHHFHDQLMHESNHLDKQIATLEKVYQRLTGYQLTVY